MAQQVAELAVRLVGDNAHVQRVFNQTTRQGASMSSSIVAGSRLMAVGFAGVAAAGTLALSVTSQVAQESAALGRELAAQGVAANTSMEDIQAIGYATREYGVDTAKAADILKDFQDKLGDFRSGEGGEFADFFEQVGDKVGLTADQLARLSGPDALIAVKKAMDDANVSADRQIFYLESIANDASRLSPLLADNGVKFRQMVSSYREMDVALTNSQLDKFADYDQDVTDLKLVWDDLTRETVIPFVSALADGARFMSDLFGTTRTERMANIREEIAELNSEVIDLQTTGKKYGGGLTGLADSLFGNSGTKGERIAERLAQIRMLQDELKSLDADIQRGGNFTPPTNTGSDNPPSGSGSNNSNDAAAKRLAAQQTAGAALLAQLDMQYADEETKLRLSLQKQLADIDAMTLSEAEIKRRGYSTLAQLKTDYETQANTDYSIKLGELEQQQAQELQAKRATLQSDLDQVRQHLMSKEQLELEATARRQQMLYNAHQAALIDEERFQQLSVQNWQKYQQDIGNEGFWQNYLESVRNTAENTDQIWANTFSTISNQMSSTVMDSLKDWQGLGDFMQNVFTAAGDAIIQTLIEIGVQRMVLWTLEKTIGTAGQAGYVAQISGEAQAMSMLAGISAFASTAAIPLVGPALAPGAMAAALGVTQPMALAASAAAASSLAGMAHDGIDSVPQEGTWLLQKGERVINAEQNEKITNALTGNGGGGFSGNVIIYNNGNAQETTNASVNSNGDLEIFLQQADAYVAQGIYSGTGQTARASQAVYGNNRARTSRR